MKTQITIDCLGGIYENLTTFHDLTTSLYYYCDICFTKSPRQRMSHDLFADYSMIGDEPHMHMHTTLKLGDMVEAVLTAALLVVVVVGAINAAPTTDVDDDIFTGLVSIQEPLCVNIMQYFVRDLNFLQLFSAVVVAIVDKVQAAVVSLFKILLFKLDFSAIL
uniref:Uncharacterized protein n=1 Tax=Glossina austeni TaxID=7395 RepID=A0A1A9VTZ0_GLOAU